MKRAYTMVNGNPEPTGTYHALVESVRAFGVEPNWRQRLGLSFVDRLQGTPLYDPVALALLIEGLDGGAVTSETARAAVDRVVALAAGSAEVPETAVFEEHGTLVVVTDISAVGWYQSVRLDECPECVREHVAERKAALLAKHGSRVADTDDAYFVVLLAGLVKAHLAKWGRLCVAGVCVRRICIVLSARSKDEDETTELDVLAFFAYYLLNSAERGGVAEARVVVDLEARTVVVSDGILALRVTFHRERVQALPGSGTAEEAEPEVVASLDSRNAELYALFDAPPGPVLAAVIAPVSVVLARKLAASRVVQAISPGSGVNAGVTTDITLRASHRGGAWLAAQPGVSCIEASVTRGVPTPAALVQLGGVSMLLSLAQQAVKVAVEPFLPRVPRGTRDEMALNARGGVGQAIRLLDSNLATIFGAADARTALRVAATTGLQPALAVLGVGKVSQPALNYATHFAAALIGTADAVDGDGLPLLLEALGANMPHVAEVVGTLAQLTAVFTAAVAARLGAAEAHARECGAELPRVNDASPGRAEGPLALPTLQMPY
jgi:hypothetical protein